MYVVCFYIGVCVCVEENFQRDFFEALNEDSSKNVAIAVIGHTEGHRIQVREWFVRESSETLRG